jgi:hypothetical protein
MIVKRKTSLKIRKIHRYLGLFLGIQFLFWTISGLYFSWTNLDEIHGDHFLNSNYKKMGFDKLISPSDLNIKDGITSISIKNIENKPYYWVNKKQLFNAVTGKKKEGITKNEAMSIAKTHLKKDLEISSVKKIEKVDSHHEYRERMLPVYVISYKNPNDLKVYISADNGQFQTIRHRNWRWFDFLWMTHTMDYQSRDNINNTTLRIFSLLGLITVMSGFLLWFVTSPTAQKQINNFKK